jgi:propanediol dehydratase small subunit
MSILIVLVLALAAAAALRGQLSNSLSYRTCQSRLWRRAFPGASRKDIRDFLALVVSAFSFRDGDRLRFRPDDEILGIFRAANPRKRITDVNEIESLATALQKRYGVLLADSWYDGLTLGALFRKVQSVRTSQSLAA